MFFETQNLCCCLWLRRALSPSAGCGEGHEREGRSVLALLRCLSASATGNQRRQETRLEEPLDGPTLAGLGAQKLC